MPLRGEARRVAPTAIIAYDVRRWGAGMNFEPQKLFIGLVDFFSVWLPGVLLTYLLKDDVASLLGVEGFPLAGVENWAVFLLASYLVGHLAFALGAYIDMPVYDRLRDGTRVRQIGRLAAGKRLYPTVVRAFARRFSKYDDGLRHARRLRDEQLGPAGAAEAINVFQWCKARLALKHREALAEVERLEADSKFFRSFCFVVLALGLWRLVWLAVVGVQAMRGIEHSQVDWWRSGGALLVGLFLFGFALWRYAERRAKASGQAYWFVLAGAEPTPAPRTRAYAAPNQPTHAGGLVLRRRRGCPEQYLRVQARDNPAQWVLPKGHIEPGEKAERTAVREVLEEAAIWARIHDELGQITFERHGLRARVQFFVMEFLGEEKVDRRSGHHWLPEPGPTASDPRLTDWQTLDWVDDLPAESGDIVRAGAAYLRRNEGAG
jgi:8-oxo-dGTP pyrophosphatase MutT (NUDIX family)